MTEQMRRLDVRSNVIFLVVILLKPGIYRILFLNILNISVRNMR